MPALAYVTPPQLLKLCTGQLKAHDLVTPGDLAAATGQWLGAMDLPVANFSVLVYSEDDPGESVLGSWVGARRPFQAFLVPQRVSHGFTPRS